MSQKKSTKSRSKNQLQEIFQDFTKGVDWKRVQTFCNRSVDQVLEHLPFAPKSKSTGHKRLKVSDVLSHLDGRLIKRLHHGLGTVGQQIGGRISHYFDVPTRSDLASLEKQLHTLGDRLSQINDSGTHREGSSARGQHGEKSHPRQHPHA